MVRAVGFIGLVVVLRLCGEFLGLWGILRGLVTGMPEESRACIVIGYLDSSVSCNEN